MNRFTILAGMLVLLEVSADGQVQPPVFESDALPQASIASGQVPLVRIRHRGMNVFSTPFTRDIGYGDGRIDVLDTTSPGGRPTLQDNGLYLRINGLDAQTCMECHSVLSNLTVPFTFGVGGVGGSNANAIFQPTRIDVEDSHGSGFASFNGRFINPPFLFGSGGIELVAKEMTGDLQQLKAQALLQPGVSVQLVTKGVSFGSITWHNGEYDRTRVVGIEHDLVVRPFGRKGEFATTRAFDVDAVQFHMGMQPTEVVGVGVDGDLDGVYDEVSPGDLSALAIFNTHLDRPEVRGITQESQRGLQSFLSIGCADCHVPELITRSPYLTYSHPEVPTNPLVNEFYRADLRQQPPGFDTAPGGGVIVACFSDLKRHNMGPKLAESTGGHLDAQFITARLWGVADTAPYLHDGRAQTLEAAILMHGGEAAAARAQFATLSPQQQKNLVQFLLTLRTPEQPAADLLAR